MTALTYKASKTFTRFHHDDTFIRIVMGPVGCMRGDSLVITEEGALPIEQIDRPMRVLSWNYHTGQFQYSLTGGAFPKGRGYLYRVKTTQGEFAAAAHHRVLCADGTYQRVDTLFQGQSVSLHSSSPDEKCSEQRRAALLGDGPHYSEKLLNLMGDYAMLARQYGQQLLEGQDTFPDFVPSQDDVHKLFSDFYSCVPSLEDAKRERLLKHNHPDQSGVLIYTDGFSGLFERLGWGVEQRVVKELLERNVDLAPLSGKFRDLLKHHLPDSKSSLYSHSYPNSFTQGYILEIERLPVKEVYWDLQVLDTNNYVTSDGSIHHNSGKSVGCCWEVYLRALKQKPNTDGIRMSRWVIVRNTLPELETTTMATWKQWFGEHIFKGAKITGRAPYKQTIEHEHPSGDGTTLHLELIFLALDGQEDIKKLMSLECTGIFFNEMRFIDEVIFREACTRPGRYPRKIDGGPTWHGIIADTNPPDDSHWIYKLVEEAKPSNVAMYYQPSGLSDQAENKENLPDGYYENMSIGKAQEWINVYVHGKYGFMQEGKSVYAECWNDDFHFTSNPIETIPGRTLIGGIDASGRSPAAVVMQPTPLGQTQVLWELCGEDIGAVMFSKVLRQEVINKFPHHNITWWGDPAGAFKSQNDERTYFEILRGEGLIVQPSPGFRTNERVEGVRSILSRNIGGKPALLVGPECKQLRKGFNGGYRYKKIGSSGSAKYTPDPEKNEYSHPHEALQYGIAGMGELNTMKQRKRSDYKTYSYETNW